MTAIPIYSMTVPAFVRGLNNLNAILDKAQEFIDTKKLDQIALLEDRLIADMLPFRRQVQIACDFAKGGTARLTGIEPPKFEDTETTIEQLKARVTKTLEYIGAFAQTAFEESAQRNINLKVRGNEISLDGYTYATCMVLPNFYFHLTTAYGLLRKNGVEIGKQDFIGQL